MAAISGPSSADRKGAAAESLVAPPTAAKSRTASAPAMQRAGSNSDHVLPRVEVSNVPAARGSTLAARAKLATFAPKLREQHGPVSTETLLAEHAHSVARRPVTEPRRLDFVGVDGMNVYNPSAPFTIAGQRVLAARVEKPEDETATFVRFFSETSPGTWQVIAGAPSFAMQDPFVAKIGGETIVGGVETYERALPKHGIGYRTVFYRGTSLDNLTRFAAGPEDMKDIRLQELPNGSILVLTRPQGRISGNSVDAGRGKIGYAVIDNLDALAKTETIAKLVHAPHLAQFVHGEWGGANEMHDLGNGKVGVLGHIAKFSSDETTRHYYAFTFTIDVPRGIVSPLEIILRRDDIDPTRTGGTRREDLWDVLFSGGLVRNPDGSAHLYVGAGDQESWSARIPDPFATK